MGEMKGTVLQSILFPLGSLLLWLLVIAIPSRVSSRATIPLHRHGSRLNHEAFSNQIDLGYISPSNTLLEIATYGLKRYDSNHLGLEDDSFRFHRALGDFDELNAILKDVTFSIPDFSADSRLWAYDIECTNIQIDDIILEHEKKGDTEFTFSTAMDGLTIDCELGWKYEWGWVGAKGRAEIYTSKSSISTDITVISKNFTHYPPTDSEISDCDASIEIDKIDIIGGGIGGFLVDIIIPLLKGRIENEVNDVICDELEILDQIIMSLIEIPAEFLTNYTGPISDERLDVLYPEKMLDVPDNSSIWNISGEGFFQIISDWINNQFGSSEEKGSTDSLTNNLTINEVIQSNFSLPGTSIIDKGIVYESEDMLTNTTVTIDEVRIIGLDTLVEFEVLSAVGNYTFSNYLSWKSLGIEVYMNVTMSASNSSNSLVKDDSITELVEHITVSSKIDDVDLDLSLLMALDLNELTLGKLLNIRSIDEFLSCIADAVHALEVSGLSLMVSNIDAPVLSGFISDGIDRVVSDLTNGIFEVYESLFIDLLPNIFQIGVRDLFNRQIASILENNEGTCKTLAYNSSNSFVNFFDLFLSENEALVAGGSGTNPYGDLFWTSRNLLEEELLSEDPTDGTLPLNELLISPLTEKQSGVAGTFDFTEALIDVKQSIDDIVEADVEFKLSDTKLEGLNSVGSPVELLVPVEPQIINNSFSFDALNASTKMLFGIHTEGTHMRNELILDVRANRIAVDFSLFVSVLERAMVNFPVQDATNLNCLLALVPAPKLDSQGIRINGMDPTITLSSLGISVEKVHFNIKCISCTSPEFEDLADLLETPEAAEDLTELSNKILDTIAGIVTGPFIQVQFDRILHEAALKCPHHQDYQPGIGQINYDPITIHQLTGNGSNATFFLAFSIVLLVLFSICFAMVNVIKFIRGREHRKWLETLSAEERYMFCSRMKYDAMRQLKCDLNTKSLFASTCVPVPVRFIIPGIILGNIALFLSGHFSIGAFVDADIKVAGQVIRFEEVYSFSIANSILEMWDAGAKTLAILVLLFSGIWPYVKLLISFILWFSPAAKISVSFRESILLKLDSLGKWSFADIFVLVVSIVSFRITVQNPDEYSFLPTDLYVLNLLVLPKFGLYANFAAQIVSQLNSHVILYYHRKVVTNFEDEERVEEICNETDKALFSHEYSRIGRKSDKFLSIRNGVNVSLLLLATTSVFFIVMGSIFPSFATEVFGLLGILDESGQDFDNAYQKHNMFSIVRVLFQQAKFTSNVGDWIGLGSLSVIFMLTICLIPIALVFINLYRWFKPMDRTQRRRIFVMAEILAAWQYLEVYIVSIIIASWQLGSLSQFMVNDYCGSLTGLFTSLTYYDFIDEADAQCFQVRATVQVATWLLFSGALGSSLLNHFVGKAEQHFESDMKVLNRGYPKEEEIDGCKDEAISLPEAKFTDFYRWLLKSKNDNPSKAESQQQIT